MNRNGSSGNPLSFTPPSGMTEVNDISSNVTTNVAIELAKLDLGDPVVTGNKTATAAAATFTAHGPAGSSIVVRGRDQAHDTNELTFLTEDGYPLIQETGHLLLLEG